MSVVLAIVAAVGYATSDVTTASIVRRVGAGAVALWSHVVASTVLLALAAVLAPAPGAAALLTATGAGLVAGAGAVAYFAALGRGPASVLAPIAAAGVLLPVGVGVVAGDRAALPAGLGALCVVAGATLLSGSRDRAGLRTPLTAVLLATGAAVAFGAYFVTVDVAVGTSGGHPLWVAGAVTTGSAVAALAYVLWSAGRAGVVPERAAWLGLSAVGAAFIVADLALAAAMSGSDVALVSVIASADPILTVAAARVVLGERISAQQAGGVAVTLAGVLGVAAA